MRFYRIFHLSLNVIFLFPLSHFHLTETSQQFPVWLVKYFYGILRSGNLLKFIETNHYLDTIEFSPDNKLLFATKLDIGPVGLDLPFTSESSLWSVETGELENKIVSGEYQMGAPGDPGVDNQPYSFVFTKDSRKLLTIDRNNMFRVWDISKNWSLLLLVRILTLIYLQFQEQFRMDST